ncbi:16S rRNA (cytidine(1402)-2'-O)-methyltransferase [Proteocatella sphenisci]|uniref:16S rRNA (cytidine(1402)-2'-O)-methyltransferase n=1 Tax=Proteocatella sphenisci TaxID=181070 RepID=UPI000490B2C8|nr:16S rRNA (cytidine(1402)-2'-O)-methyltransferase [Proteocatella sphenisci]
MLYICPTPIGNLEDITIRVLNTLKEVDYIACEDTRHTIKLLNHYDIKNKLVSVHEHNEFVKADSIITDLQNGLNIALVSDAGMPGIQDPGKILIEAAIEKNLEFTVLPGPCAFVTAAIGSGIVEEEFTFVGFVSRKTKERKLVLEAHKTYKGELIFYESPHRIKDLLEDILDVLGNRKVVLAREISKKFETYVRKNVSELLTFLEEKPAKGELVLIVEGNKEVIEFEFTDFDIENLIKSRLEEKYSKKDAVRLVSKELKISKNRVYEIAMNIKYQGD